MSKVKNDILINAASLGSLNTIKEIVDSGFNILESVKEKLIEICIRSEDYKIIEYLIDLDISNNLNYYLYMAAEIGNVNSVKYFIMNGADINLHNNSIVHYAVNSKNKELIIYLFKENKNVSSEAKEKGLQQAVVLQYKDIVDLIIDLEPKIELSGAFRMATDLKATDLAELLINKSTNSNLKEKWLEYAIIYNNMEIVNLFNEDVKIDKDSIYLLTKAVDNQNLALIKFLINKGIDPSVDILGEVLQSAFNEFSTKNGNEIFKYLIESGFDPGVNNNIILSTATYYGNFNVIKYLIEDINMDIGIILSQPKTDYNEEVLKWANTFNLRLKLKNSLYENLNAKEDKRKQKI